MKKMIIIIQKIFYFVFKYTFKYENNMLYLTLVTKKKVIIISQKQIFKQK